MKKNTMQRYFKLAENRTNVRTEVIAGITTFLTMSYIILVNPAILGVTGMNVGALFVATCLVAATGSFLTGILANYPVAVAPSMGLNVYFAYIIVQKLGYSWQNALGMVFMAGILLVLLTISGLLRRVIDAIPRSLCIAIAAGIGLFIGVVALQNVGILAAGSKIVLSLGKLYSLPVLLFIIGFLVIIILSYFKFPAAMMAGILLVSIISLLLGITHFYGIVALPPSIIPTFLKLNLKNTWLHEGIIIIFTFFLVALFDSTGTLIGVMHQTKIHEKTVGSKRLSMALLATSIATMCAGLLGSSTSGQYIESASGISVGGRTGLTAIVVGCLFLLALFFSPLVKTVPNYATAPALLFVACLMTKHIRHIPWKDLTETIPCLIVFIMIPLTFSIADGIGLGFISYVLVKLITGKIKDLNIILIILAILFLAHFIFKP